MEIKYQKLKIKMTNKNAKLTLSYNKIFNRKNGFSIAPNTSFFSTTNSTNYTNKLRIIFFIDVKNKVFFNIRVICVIRCFSFFIRF